MKTILPSLIAVLISTSAFSCEELALEYFSRMNPELDNLRLVRPSMNVERGPKLLSVYGRTFLVEDLKPTQVIFVGYESFGGYGVDALVVSRQTCEILQSVTVYEE